VVVAAFTTHPSPAVTANVTATFGTPAPAASMILTVGRSSVVIATTADCCCPLSIIRAAGVRPVGALGESPAHATSDDTGIAAAKRMMCMR
jgi:hypothetical protein